MEKEEGKAEAEAEAEGEEVRGAGGWEGIGSSGSADHRGLLSAM